jgi:uncharacterized membrane protein
MKALSLYPQDNRDVQSILKTYEQAALPPPPAPAAAAKPAIPAVPAKAAAPTATASPPVAQSSNIGQERAIALEAIKKGAPEAAVRKRFKDTTGQEL